MDLRDAGQSAPLTLEEVNRAEALVMELDEESEEALLDFYFERQGPLFEFVIPPMQFLGETSSRRGIFLLLVVLEAFSTRFPNLGQVKAGRLQRELRELESWFALIIDEQGESFWTYAKEPVLLSYVSEYLKAGTLVQAHEDEYLALFPLLICAVQALHDQGHHPPAPLPVMLRKMRPKR